MNFYSSNGAGFYLPPSPIGNIAINQQMAYTPVGGYYYNNYNSYFNPWELQKRQDEMIKQHNQAVQNQLDIIKQIILNANESIGIKINEADLDRDFEKYKPTYTNSSEYYQQQRENERDARLLQAINSGPCGSRIAEARVSSFMKEEEKNLENTKGKSLEEQYIRLNEIMFDQREEERKKKQRNMKVAYNPGDYRTLIEQSMNVSRSSPVTNIDDLEVVLPGTLTRDYSEKRALFMQRLLSK